MVLLVSRLLFTWPSSPLETAEVDPKEFVRSDVFKGGTTFCSSPLLGDGAWLSVRKPVSERCWGTSVTMKS